eukprot:CAMPEP_0174738274 /NCGR_PEP_ID=MMETSP1094-20130205/69653_1 /TAXON_ID=156173 /ORGANISM="Chrysochromulina brevifilum, Strain UTEX LB 985" /LENGTH=417 /DNA_ID=CAMNT_0015941643 /DNA_START=90 /DNA_END=1343 /DNA_ORIENTATION=+
MSRKPAAEPASVAASKVDIPISEAETLLFKGIKSIGYTTAEANVMKDAMMWAQLRDNNQGFIKLTSGGLAKSGDGAPKIEKDSPTGARVNGNQAMSMVVMDYAVDVAIEKALASNVGVVGTFNTSQSCGALGFYAEKIATAGLVGVLMVTSPEFVAPHGAKQPILGTNPITCAVPTDQGLFLVDQATAAFPWFGLLEAQTAGVPIPEGVAFDSDGIPTTDASKALKGALRTFDRGYKSSNLALMVELLAGPLVGAAHINKLSAKSWGNLVIAIHPRMLGDANTFYKNAGEVLTRVRNAERLPGVDAIIIPGEREAKVAEARLAVGTVPVEPNMLNALKEMAASWDASSAQPASPSMTEVESLLLPKLEQLMHRLDRLETAFQKLEISKGGDSSGLAELKARAAAAARFGTQPVNNFK